MTLRDNPDRVDALFDELSAMLHEDGFELGLERSAYEDDMAMFELSLSLIEMNISFVTLARNSLAVAGYCTPTLAPGGDTS